jgi:hypothetical protein
MAESAGERATLDGRSSRDVTKLCRVAGFDPQYVHVSQQTDPSFTF